MNTTVGNVDLLSRLMDASSRRHQVISANVANVNTPGYRRSEVQFEDELAKLLKGSDKVEVDDLEQIKLKVGQTQGLASREDGNNVNIDMELGELSKNSLLFETYTQLMATQIGMMSSAISGRS